MSGLPMLPALVPGVVSHRRASPIQHTFRHRVYQWLIDLDDVPRLRFPLRLFASFRSADHLGGDSASIKEAVIRYVATHGVVLGADCRVLMLTNPRVLGYVFNPLTVFWCYVGDDLVCTVAEVHNTYGERHAYLLRPDKSGTASAAKTFYVSPFFDVSGCYTLTFSLTADRVTTRVALTRSGAVAFTASFSGRSIPASTGRFLRMLLRHPLMPQRVTALIRLHGIRLWWRRLPVHPRPAQPRGAGV